MRDRTVVIWHSSVLIYSTWIDNNQCLDGGRIFWSDETNISFKSLSLNFAPTISHTKCFLVDLAARSSGNDQKRCNNNDEACLQLYKFNNNNNIIIIIITIVIIIILYFIIYIYYYYYYYYYEQFITRCKSERILVNQREATIIMQESNNINAAWANVYASRFAWIDEHVEWLQFHSANINHIESL